MNHYDIDVAFYNTSIFGASIIASCDLFIKLELRGACLWMPARFQTKIIIATFNLEKLSFMYYKCHDLSERLYFTASVVSFETYFDF